MLDHVVILENPLVNAAILENEFAGAVFEIVLPAAVVNGPARVEKHAVPFTRTTDKITLGRRGGGRKEGRKKGIR